MKKYNCRAQRYLTILANAVLQKNGECRLPRYRDLRKVLKTIIESRKQMGFAEERS